VRSWVRPSRTPAAGSCLFPRVRSKHCAATASGGTKTKSSPPAHGRKAGGSSPTPSARRSTATTSQKSFRDCPRPRGFRLSGSMTCATPAKFPARSRCVAVHDSANSRAQPLTTTRRYTHVDQAVQKAALHKVGDLFENSNEPNNPGSVAVNAAVKLNLFRVK
jgi:hypothetical protein